MPGSVLLDTSAAVDWLTGSAAVVGDLAAADVLYLPIVALAELYYGAALTTKPHEQRQRVLELASLCRLLDRDAQTADHYGQLKLALRRRGRDNDLWIAAVAIQHGLPLVTSDRHFNDVEGLTLHPRA